MQIKTPISITTSAIYKNNEMNESYINDESGPHKEI